MELNELIGKIRSHFSTLYNKGLKESNTFLAFEPIGQPISPDDFRGPDGQFSNNLATDFLSLLADVVPPIDDDYIPNSTTRISSCYETLLDSMHVFENNLSGDKGPTLELYARLISQARGQMDLSKQASIIEKMNYSYPCYATPANWYDKDGKDIWTSFNTNALQGAPSGHDTVNPVKRNYAFWRSATAVSPIKASAKPITVEVRDHRSNPQTEIRDHRRSAVVRDHRNSAFTAGGGRSENVLTTQPGTWTAKTFIIDKDLLNKRSSIVNDTAKPVNANNFSIDFDYLFVSLRRSWMSGPLMYQFTNWYSLTQKANTYSSGENNEANKGLLCSIPKAMLLVKDLKITANWSEDDKRQATQQNGLGFFNIARSNFGGESNNQLVVPGIQILAWLCEVQPKLPLFDDPNLA